MKPKFGYDVPINYKTAVDMKTAIAEQCPNELPKEISGHDIMNTRLQTTMQIAPAEDLDSLIQGCKRQDRESQRLLYLQYYGFALKIVYRYVADYSAAIRLTNETMLKVFRSFSDFKVLKHMNLEISFGCWMKDIFIRAVVRWSLTPDRGKVPGVTTIHTDWDVWAPAAADDLPDTELYRILISQLGSLPLCHRIIFNLCVIDRYPASEVARLSDMKLNKVERKLSEARSMLGYSTLGDKIGK
jgi:DNA-directed RNA polymerase specialized sigma24 family protein